VPGRVADGALVDRNGGNEIARPDIRHLLFLFPAAPRCGRLRGETRRAPARQTNGPLRRRLPIGPDKVPNLDEVWPDGSACIRFPIVERAPPDI
jgi:hypothetical protein